MRILGVTLNDRDAPLWAALASVVALATALGSQYIGGLAPCELCLWQRAPYGAAIVVGLTALLWFRGRHERVVLTLVLVLLFGAGMLVAAYHAGVEQHWIAGPSACTGNASLDAAKTLEDLRKQLLATPVVRCDEIPWSLFGVSIAGWNALASLVLAVYCALAAVRQVRDNRA